MSKLGGRQLAAAIFGILGIATIVLMVGVIALGMPVPKAHLVLAILYGVAASFTGYGLRRQSRLAPRAYLVWCATIVLYMITLFREDPSLADPWIISLAALLFAAFYFGWRKIQQVCAPAASLQV